MTSVSGTRAPQPAPRSNGPSEARAPSPAAQQQGGAQAMRDAFASARGKVETLSEAAGKPKQKGVLQKELGAREQKGEARGRTEAEPSRGSTPIQAERQADGQGLALSGQPAAPPPVTLPAMPAAHVDPSAFAQTMADLWTRENGRGSKEVRVRFGDSAWPATGARLVRNAAGTLDIALTTDTANGQYDARLDSLRGHLADAGLDVGALSVEADG
jgi:hypothetical protein